MDSLAGDVNSGMGKLRASPSSHYNNCPQKEERGIIMMLILAELVMDTPKAVPLLPES